MNTAVRFHESLAPYRSAKGGYSSCPQCLYIGHQTQSSTEQQNCCFDWAVVHGALGVAMGMASCHYRAPVLLYQSLGSMAWLAGLLMVRRMVIFAPCSLIRSRGLAVRSGHHRLGAWGPNSRLYRVWIFLRLMFASRCQYLCARRSIEERRDIDHLPSNQHMSPMLPPMERSRSSGAWCWPHYLRCNSKCAYSPSRFHSIFIQASNSAWKPFHLGSWTHFTWAKDYLSPYLLRRAVPVSHSGMSLPGSFLGVGSRMNDVWNAVPNAWLRVIRWISGRALASLSGVAWPVESVHKVSLASSRQHHNQPATIKVRRDLLFPVSLWKKWKEKNQCPWRWHFAALYRLSSRCT